MGMGLSVVGPPSFAGITVLKEGGAGGEVGLSIHRTHIFWIEFGP